jgi:hypothetical protein
VYIPGWPNMTLWLASQMLPQRMLARLIYRRWSQMPL